MKSVTIVDYGAGNLRSLHRALNEVGADVTISTDKRDIASAERLIIPGVGSFADGMKNLRSLGLVDSIRKVSLDLEHPVLGICLGMQLLSSKGIEGGQSEGLGIVPGDAVRLEPKSDSERIPHVGWNDVKLVTGNGMFSGIPDGSDFYFVHSYHVIPENASHIIGTTYYCGETVAVVRRANTWGVQFHPEKSGPLGYRLLKNFLNL